MTFIALFALLFLANEGVVCKLHVVWFRIHFDSPQSYFFNSGKVGNAPPNICMYICVK